MSAALQSGEHPPNKGWVVTRENETDFARVTIEGWAPKLGGLAETHQLA